MVYGLMESSNVNVLRDREVELNEVEGKGWVCLGDDGNEVHSMG